MAIVDCVVNKTEKIEPSTDVLKGILRPVVEGVEEILWPPRDPEAINQMEKAKEDIDKPSLAAKLQKVLQLYAATVLYKRSYAKKGTLLKSLTHSKLPLSTNRISSRLHPIIGNQVVKAEHFLETLIKAPEEQWNKFFLEGLTLGKGEVTLEELSAVIKKRIECTLIRTVSNINFVLCNVSLYTYNKKAQQCERKSNTLTGFNLGLNQMIIQLFDPVFKIPHT
ncbi:BnaC09g37410D [Brassica napus]|uniref:BnaC09g37410D protein n=1 Tax=Brassica napus TaxID=3708 RepID=A0A078HED9_BRANA|nr:BnaC09g37410D [Brassica napus]